MSRRQRGEVLWLILSLASRPDGVSRAELADRIGIGRDVQTGKAWAPSMGAGSVFAWRPAA